MRTADGQLLRRGRFTLSATQGPTLPRVGSKHWRNRRLTHLALLVLGVGLLAYWPSVVEEYGRADDYRSLYVGKSSDLGSAWDSSVGGGRPIPAVLQLALMSLTDSVAGLAWLRLLAVLAIAVSAALVALWSGWKTREATLTAWAVGAPAAALVVAVPGAQAVATWAILAVQSWALPTALLAGILLDAWRPRAGRQVAYFVAALLIFATAYNYQQFTAVAIFPPAVGAALRYARGTRPGARPAMFAAATVGAALLSNYLFVLAMGSNVASRVTDRPPVAEILRWFFTVYLPRTVDLEVPDTRLTTVICAAIVALLLAVPAIKGLRYLAVSGAVVAAWFVTSAPMLVVGELWASYRVVYPAQLVLWVGAVLAATWALTERRRETRPGTAAIVAASASVVALLLVALAGRRAYLYYAAPNAIDWRSAQCVAQDMGEGLRPGDVVVVQPWSAARSPVIYGDEPGIIAGAIDWAVTPMLWLAFDENGESPRFNPDEQTVVTPTTRPMPPASRFVTVDQYACDKPAR